MRAIDKLKFWKKDEKEDIKDDTALKEDNLGMDLNKMPGGQTDYGQQGFQEPQNFQRNFNQENLNSKDELISAKLDTIKAMLENINHRIARLEKVAGVNDEEY